MNTKEKILVKALSLFAEKGYSDVYVGEIAEAVGIKAPSLYKHYKGKQEIFDSCIKYFYERMQTMTTALPPLTSAVDKGDLKNTTIEEAINISKTIFLFHLKDEVASNLRKMLSIERYRNPELNKLFEELFLDEPIEFEEELFKMLIDAKVLKDNNPRVLAYRYYTPIFFLLTKYDMHLSDEEEAIKELEIIVREFYQVYKLN